MTRSPPLLLLLAMLAAPGTDASAARWLHVATTPAETVVEIDGDGITGRGQQVQVPVRYLFGPDGHRVIDGRPAHQALTLTLVDCEAGTSGVLASAWYDASGRLLRRQGYPTPQMAPIRAGSTMEAVAGQVCG